jgi:hypothetical protein
LWHVFSLGLAQAVSCRPLTISTNERRRFLQIS